MLEAAFWGLVGGLALLLGAGVGLAVRVPQRVIGLVMAFGAGVLIAALTFELTAEALDRGGADSTALGLAAGSLSFFGIDAVVDRMGGGERKRSGGQQAGGVAAAIAVGAVLDGIPEAIAIGVSLLEGGGVSVAVVVAVFLSNVPESLSAATGLKQSRSPGYVLRMWTVVALASAAAAGLGYGALGGASEDLIAFIQAFAAGAILTMLADTMMPEAFEAEGRSKLTGAVTTLGFALAALLTTVE
jgi:zinc transporter, ZIP family